MRTFTVYLVGELQCSLAIPLSSHYFATHRDCMTVSPVHRYTASIFYESACCLCMPSI